MPEKGYWYPPSFFTGATASHRIARSKIFKIASRLRAGVVWANACNKFDPTSPFGAYRESGFGWEGGLHGLLPYLALTDEIAS